MMPEMDGLTLAKEIRTYKPDIPIIFLTAKNQKEDIIEGFKSGADDYITKPFSMEELLYRIEAILRRTTSTFTKQKRGILYNRRLYPLILLNKYLLTRISQLSSQQRNQNCLNCYAGMEMKYWKEILL